MNKWERQWQFQLDWVHDMVEYAKSVCPDVDSVKYRRALEEYVHSDRFIQFREKWESENGKLEDET